MLTCMGTYRRWSESFFSSRRPRERGGRRLILNPSTGRLSAGPFFSLGPSAPCAGGGWAVDVPAADDLAVVWRLASGATAALAGWRPAFSTATSSAAAAVAAVCTALNAATRLSLSSLPTFSAATCGTSPAVLVTAVFTATLGSAADGATVPLRGRAIDLWAWDIRQPDHQSVRDPVRGRCPAHGRARPKDRRAGSGYERSPVGVPVDAPGAGQEDGC